MSKTAGLLEQLEKGVQEVFTSDRFQRWLDVQSRFHRYSASNTILIWLQRPEASRVAGYKAWQKLNRQVRKGEKGISIFAPMIYKNEDDEEEIKGYRPVTVFDVSQTDGEPLPEIAEEITTEAEEAERIIEGLREFANELGLTVETYEKGAHHAHGYFSPEERKIAVREAASVQTAKTFTHEVTHALTHKDETDRAKAEIIAESTAYIVLHHFGIDTSEYSFDYVASWSLGEKPEIIREVASTIQKTSQKIISRLEIYKTEQAA